MYTDFIDNELEFEFDDDISISVEEWDLMSPEQQEEYIIINNIKVKYSTNISDTLSRGFGRLDQWGFWEYQCKQI